MSRHLLSQEVTIMPELAMVSSVAIFSLSVVAIVALVREPKVAKKALDKLLGFWRTDET